MRLPDMAASHGERYLPPARAGVAPFSSRYDKTQTSGAFQLMVISLVAQDSMLSTKHFSGAQPERPAPFT